MKTECIRKSLTSDFKNVGMAIGIILGLIIGSNIIINASVYLFNIIESIRIVIGAYEVFIVCGILSTGLGFAMNLVTTKKQLVDFGTLMNYFVGIVFIIPVYAGYCINSWANHVNYGFFYPDVNLIAVNFVFAGIVLTPFALAYVRCKEEVDIK